MTSIMRIIELDAIIDVAQLKSSSCSYQQQCNFSRTYKNLLTPVMVQVVVMASI